MKFVQLTVLICISMLLAACAAPASRDAMEVPSTIGAQYSQDNFLTRKVTVGTVTGGKETNPAWTSEIGNEEFAAALRNSLETAYLLVYHTDAQYILDAELVEIHQPIFGFTYTVKSRIRYTLQEAGSGKTVLQEEITADGTATTGDAFMGVKRLKIANERSAQENIKQLIDRLYEFHG